MKKFVLQIAETGRNFLKDEPTIFNNIQESFDSLEEVLRYVEYRYGKVPGMRKKVFVDLDGETIPIGFLHSFWNQDYSHSSQRWFQTDWVTFGELKADNLLHPIDLSFLKN